MGLLDKLHDSTFMSAPAPPAAILRVEEELELYRLEQRYTRRKNRVGFTSDAQYVNGEYIYTTPLQPVRELSGQKRKSVDKVKVRELNGASEGAR